MRHSRRHAWDDRNSGARTANCWENTCLRNHTLVVLQKARDHPPGQTMEIAPCGLAELNPNTKLTHHYVLRPLFPGLQAPAGFGVAVLSPRLPPPSQQFHRIQPEQREQSLTLTQPLLPCRSCSTAALRCPANSCTALSVSC